MRINDRDAMAHWLDLGFEPFAVSDGVVWFRKYEEVK